MNNLGSWTLNNVHEVDCLSGLRELPDECLDVVVTSPPYWGQRGDKGIGSEMDPRDYVNNLTEIFVEVLRCLKSSGLIWLNIGDAYNTPINWRLEDKQYSTLGADKQGLADNNSAYTKNRGKRRAFLNKDVPWAQYGNLLSLPNRIVLNLCDAGALYRGEVIWAKRKAMPEGRCRRPHRRHEAIYIVAKNECHNFRVTPPVPSVWDLALDLNTTPHTSTFPLSLPIACIEASDPLPGAVIFDPFMGSGTTGVAAKQLGFDYLGFELNSRNAEIANQRIRSHQVTIALPLKEASS